MKSLHGLVEAFAEERLREEEFVLLFRTLYEAMLRSSVEWIHDPAEKRIFADVYSYIQRAEAGAGAGDLRAAVRREARLLADLDSPRGG